MPDERTLTLYRNGSVYSAADPFASAMLVDGGTVAWLGSEQAATSIADSSMKVVDLDGALVAPGFVDSHVHLSDTGEALGSLDLSGVGSAAGLLEALASAAARAGESGQPGVLRGHGWDESGWDDPILPTSHELARAAGGRPVLLTRVDVHSALVSPALAASAGLDGRDGMDDGGPLAVRDALAAARAAARPTGPDEIRALHSAALAHAAANGHVAVVEQAAPHIGGAEDLRVLAAREGAADEPEVLAYWGQLVGGAGEGREVLDGLGAPVLGLAGDLTVDGSIGSRTALLRADYADAPGRRGHGYLTAEQIGAHVAACTELGIQAGFHVIGDGGLERVLEGFARAAAAVGAGPVRAGGHRLEHAEMVGDAEAAALAEFAVTVSAQPLFDAAWGRPGGLYERRLGARREGMNPFARLFAAGVPVCFGSDSPVCAMSPWDSIRACLTHSDPGQRISARAAFIGHTRAAWRAVRHADPLMGQLVPGAPASFAVWRADELMVQVADDRVQAWSTDPRARTPLLPALDTENAPECLQTVHRGRELFRRSGFGA